MFERTSKQRQFPESLLQGLSLNEPTNPRIELVPGLFPFEGLSVDPNSFPSILKYADATFTRIYAKVATELGLGDRELGSLRGKPLSDFLNDFIDQVLPCYVSLVSLGYTLDQLYTVQAQQSPGLSMRLLVRVLMKVITGGKCAHCKSVC
jgi:hypothetical protein